MRRKGRLRGPEKKALDFREWKRKEEEKLSKPSLKLALRHQLRWLVLTLQAASENADRAKLAPMAQQAMDGMFRDIEQLKDQQAVLKQPVTGTVFAKAYEIAGLKLDKWPLTPTDVTTVYDQLLLPPYRNPQGLAQLREGWQKRMQQEGAMHEFWAASTTKGKDEKERVGMADAMRPPEFDKFIADTLPVLQWQMEMDLFKAGDQSGAALRMLSHIEKHVAHPAAKEWSDQFRQALSPTPPAAPVPTAKAP